MLEAVLENYLSFYYTGGSRLGCNCWSCCCCCGCSTSGLTGELVLAFFFFLSLLSRFIPRCTVLTWAHLFARQLKAALQYGHLYGFSLVWMYSCSRRWGFTAKPLLQKRHWYGFWSSGVWMLMMWFFRTWAVLTIDMRKQFQRLISMKTWSF